METLDHTTPLTVDLRGRRVSFLIADVYLPSPAEVLAELHHGQVLEGEVVDVSDGDEEEEEAFVVVRVKGLARAVVVPRNRLLDGGP